MLPESATRSKDAGTAQPRGDADREPTGGSKSGATLQGVPTLDRLKPGPPKPFSPTDRHAAPPDKPRSNEDYDTDSDSVDEPPDSDVSEANLETQSEADAPNDADDRHEADSNDGAEAEPSDENDSSPPPIEDSGAELGRSDSAVDKLRRERRQAYGPVEKVEKAASSEADSDEDAPADDSTEDAPTTKSDDGTESTLPAPDQLKTSMDRMSAPPEAVKTSADGANPDVGRTELENQFGYESIVEHEDLIRIRSTLPDAQFDLRIDDKIYTEIEAERLASLIIGGDILVVDAISTGNDDWAPLSKHPALAELRRHSADSVQDVLGPEDEDEAAEAPPEPTDEGKDAEGIEESDDSPERSDDPSDSPENSRSGALATIAISVAILGLAAVAAVWLGERSENTDGNSESPGSEGTVSTESSADESNTTQPGANAESEAAREPPVEVTNALATAHRTLHRAAEFDPTDADLQRRTAEYLESEGEHRRASRIYDLLWRKGKDDRSFVDHYLNLLLQGGRYSQVRRTAIDAIQTFDETDRYESIYETSIDEDPRLGDYNDTDLGELSDVTAARPADKLDFRGYALTGPSGEVEYLFAPDGLDEESWRDRVAAWRLCELVECGFEIPRTRAASVERSELETLLAAGSEESEARLSELDWNTTQNGDEYVRGALRNWPGDVHRWPIERHDVWRNWLSIYEEPEWDRTVKEALDGLDKNERDPLVPEPIDHWTVRRLASQLSGLLTFDYLTNNWDRFRPEPDDFGAANHVTSQSFVTIRTDTAFQERGSRRVEGRFNWTDRFSRDQLLSLKLLNKRRARSVLYPALSGSERQKFFIFWRQRKRILNRVDHLSRRHGRDAVVFFE